MKYNMRLLSPLDAEAYLALKLRALRESRDLLAMSYDEYSDTLVGDAAKQLVATNDSFVFGAFSESQLLVGMVEFHRRTLRKLQSGCFRIASAGQ